MYPHTNLYPTLVSIVARIVILTFFACRLHGGWKMMLGSLLKTDSLGAAEVFLENTLKDIERH